MSASEQAEFAHLASGAGQLAAECERLRRLLPRFIALSLEVRGACHTDDLCWFVCRYCGQTSATRARKDLRESEIPHGEGCPVGEAVEVLDERDPDTETD